MKCPVAGTSPVLLLSSPEPLVHAARKTTTTVESD